MGVQTRGMSKVLAPIPVTLLSGFLGSGKTTLLKKILTSPDHALRIAVIVNDVAALNIDASLVRRHVVSQTEEKLIQLENGCICCSLRGDLLEELARLAKGGGCDYVVIESTGISEPMQVAETFTEEFTQAMIQAAEEGEMEEKPEDRRILQEIADLGGLHKIAKLDTLVTVIDAFNFLSNFSTVDFISDRWGKDQIDPEDERTVTDLMVDQIEFSTTIILNKTHSVAAEDRDRILGIIKQLNPTAKVLQSNYCNVDIKEVIGTGTFEFEKAATGMGWLQSLHDLAVRDINGQKKITPTPETEEYGISSFVYRARRPFNPKRLYRLIHDKFVIMEGVIEEDGDEVDEEEAMDEDGDDKNEAEEDTGNDDENGTSGDGSAHSASEDSWSDVSMEDAEPSEDFSKSIDPKEAAKNKSKDPVFKGLLRSKGFVWLATRPGLHGEWSQAGTMLTLQGGGPWFCVLDRAQWPNNEATVKSIMSDFEEPWGDRRQEIVFIGEKLNHAGLREKFDECLLTDAEMKKWEKTMRLKNPEKMHDKLAQLFEDGFEDWPELVHDDEDGDQRHEGHSHHNHSHGSGGQKRATAIKA